MPDGRRTSGRPALGLTAETVDRPEFLLTDGDAEHALWLNVVPEPKTVKQRVHLDLHVAAVCGPDRPRVRPCSTTASRGPMMADPEGGELCAFVRDARTGSPTTACTRWWWIPLTRRRSPAGGRTSSACRCSTGRTRVREPLLAGRARRARPARWSSPGCPSPRRSRTGCTGTSRGGRRACSRRGARAAPGAGRRDQLAHPGRPGGQRVLRLPPAMIRYVTTVG